MSGQELEKGLLWNNGIRLRCARMPKILMHAPANHPGQRNVLRFSLFGLVATTSRLPFCVCIENPIADDFIDKLKDSIERVKGQSDSTILDALFLQSECSDELWECRKPGALADTTDVRCFSICITADTGCRSCCSDGTCYTPAREEKSLGSCTPCQDDDNDRQCALACFTTNTKSKEKLFRIVLLIQLLVNMLQIHQR